MEGKQTDTERKEINEAEKAREIVYWLIHSIGSRQNLEDPENRLRRYSKVSQRRPERISVGRTLVNNCSSASEIDMRKSKAQAAYVGLKHL